MVWVWLDAHTLERAYACTYAQVFLHSMDDFKPVNAIYAEFFGDHKPARSAVQVARLPLDALFEIEAIVRCVLTPRSHE